MPSAWPELQAKFPGYDQEALDVIKDNYIVSKGFVIYPKTKGYKGTQREEDALDYLFYEWDFAYSPEEPIGKEEQPSS